jgi:hypothetical protein
MYLHKLVLISLHLLTRRSDVARRLDSPLTAIVVFIQLLPETLKHCHEGRRRLLWLSFRHCIVSCSFEAHYCAKLVSSRKTSSKQLMQEALQQP